mmetsp:Transcript_12418/g.50828  ORF Transcript_12418/g.50828 Transcript_12418/m.50828 type:complete len:89 (-) Transcript_12418:139-405(-)
MLIRPATESYCSSNRTRFGQLPQRRTGFTEDLFISPDLKHGAGGLVNTATLNSVVLNIPSKRLNCKSAVGTGSGEKSFPVDSVTWGEL